MPDTPQTPNAATAATAAAAAVIQHNDQIASQVASQSLERTDTSDTSNALDKLAQEAAQASQTPDPKPDTKPDTKLEAEAVKPSTPAASDAAKPDTKPDTAPDEFADIQLPPKTSLKASEAFELVKSRAAESIRQATEEAAKLRAEAEALRKEKLEQQALTPEAAKELEELREFRAKFDVEADPVFRQKDAEADGIKQTIYATLRRSPLITDASIKQIEDLGGPLKINVAKLLESLGDPNLSALVNAHVASLDARRIQREQEMAAAKGRATDFVAQRAKELAGASAGEATKVVGEVERLVKEAAWLKLREEKTEADKEHNKLVRQCAEEARVAAKENSVELRALSVLGMAKIAFMERILEGARAGQADAEAKLKEANDKLAAANAELDAVRRSGSRIRTGGAPKVGGTAPVPQAEVLNEHTGSALDAARRVVLEERSRSQST